MRFHRLALVVAVAATVGLASLVPAGDSEVNEARLRAKQLRDANKFSEAIGALEKVQHDPSLEPPYGNLRAATLYHELGSLHYTARNFVAAKDCLGQALAIRQRLLPPGSRELSHTLRHLGLIAEAEGRNPRESRFLFDSAAAKRPPGAIRTGGALVALGLVGAAQAGVVKTRADFDRVAEQHYEAAIKDIGRLAQPSPHDIADRVRFETRLAALQDARGAADEARAHEKAVRAELNRNPARLNDLDRVKALIGLGSLHRLEKDDRAREAALADYQTALALLQKLGLSEPRPTVIRKPGTGGAKAPAHISAATCLVNIAYFEAIKALKAIKKPSEAYPLLVQAEADCLQALQIARAVAEYDAAGQTPNDQFEAAHEYRKYLDAYLTLAAALAAAEKKLGAAFRAPPAEKVYAAALPWKGAAYARQLWQHQASGLTDGGGLKLRDELVRLNQELAARTHRAPPDAAGAVKEDRNTVKQLVELLKRREEVYRKVLAQTVKNGPRPLSSWAPALVRKALPDARAALVDFYVFERYFVTDEALKFRPERRPAVVAFVTRKTGAANDFAMVPLGELAPIADAVTVWHKNLGDPNYDHDLGLQQAAAVHKLVWEPLLDRLKGVNKVYISPDGPLGNCAFAALPGSAKGKYLLDDFEITHVPCPGLLAEPPPAVPGGPIVPRLLAVSHVDVGDADPKRTDPKKNLIAGPRDEKKFAAINDDHAAALTAAFEKRYPNKAGEIELLQRGAATVANFRARASGAQYLDLFLHGFYNLKPKGVPVRSLLNLDRSGETPLAERDLLDRFNLDLMSGLAFDGTNTRPIGGFLTAAELAEFDLHSVRLATVVACDASLGTVKGGEGMLSIQRAFQLSGVAKTLTAGWKVNDKKSQQLMAEFNAQVFAQKLAPAAALRKAQQAFIAGAKDQTNSHLPCFWAAWVISGSRSEAP